MIASCHSLKLKHVKYVVSQQGFLPWPCDVRRGPFQILSVKKDAFLAFGVTIAGSLRVLYR